MAIVNNDLLQLSGQTGQFTFYQKNGKTIMRPAHSNQPRSMTLKQFILRQRLTHNNALWKKLQDTKMVFIEGGSSACHRFRSINRNVPDVFLTKQLRINQASLLLPGMVISDGPLKSIQYQLDEADGKPALFTDLTKTEVKKGTLLLYVLRQDVETHQYFDEIPQLNIKVETITPDCFNIVPSTLLTPYRSPSGCLVLTGDMFADPMLGFALIRVIDGHSSPQYVVTNCTYYQRYTTDDALYSAAKSYGGFTD